MLALRALVATTLLIAGLTGLVRGQSSGGGAVLIHLDDAVNPTTASFLVGALEEAVANGAVVAIVRIDTPGGRVDAMRDMVTSLLDAQLPTVAYISPAGARAASAGTFVTAAAHVAAMAPGTNIGAASPVDATGDDLPETLEGKTTEDLAAFIREVAALRGRNAGALEEAVREAKAYGASEAAELGVVDLVAVDVPDLLHQIDGRAFSVKAADGSETTVTLLTTGLTVTEVRPTLLSRMQSFLADPSIAYLLLSLGWVLLWVEAISGFSTIVAGLTGALLMGLGFVGLVNLPSQWLGAALIAAGVLLTIGELNVDGFGVLGGAAIIAFIAGSVVLLLHFGTPTPVWSGQTINLALFVPIVSIVTVGGGLMVYNIVTARRRKYPVVARRMLVGATGRTKTALSPEGGVFVHGEDWRGRLVGGGRIERGTEVRVVGVDGATLLVTPVAEGTGT